MPGVPEEAGVDVDASLVAAVGVIMDAVDAIAGVERVAGDGDEGGACDELE